MTVTDDKKYENDVIIDAKPYEEPTAMVTAVDAGPAPSGSNNNNTNGPPIPPDHARFYCSKCHTVSNIII